MKFPTARVTGLTTDSDAYLDVAASLRAGRGIVQTAVDSGAAGRARLRVRDSTPGAARARPCAGGSDRGKSAGLTTAEREELARLRKENRQLRLESDILRNAAFFGKENA